MQSQITSADDARVSRFVNTTDPHRVESTTHFLVESENVVTRFLASDFVCETVLCAEHKVERIAPLLPPGTELLFADRRIVNEIVGFKFHSGVMAIGRRKPEMRIDELAATLPVHDRRTLLVLPEVTDAANIGGMIRTAAAFGCAGLLLGERCRDPFIRQTIRVSMGAIFKLPIVRSADIRRDLDTLRSRYGFQLVATALDPRAQELGQFAPAARTALLMGNEGPGLDRDLIDLCDRIVAIPMRLGTDSLNVTVACGVFLYHFTRG